MNNITERVIQRLRKANKCGRYSDATVEKILEEVLEEEMKEMACCSSKEAEHQEEKKPLTFKEILEQSQLDLDAAYKQVLVITEDEDGYITSCAGNPAGIEDRLQMYVMVKNKLEEIMLQGIPLPLVKLYEKFNQI